MCFNLLKKYITAAFFCIGLLFMPQSKAATYTHTLQYIVDGLDGTNDQLTATVTFDDTQVPADTVNSTFDSNFVTNLTFTYTPGGGNPQVLFTQILLMVEILTVLLSSANGCNSCI